MKLNQLTLKAAIEGLKKKEFTGGELFESCRQRIQLVDKKINAFLTVCEKQDGSGVPVAVKDNYLTRGICTTASSKVLENFVPQYDATVWRRVKDSSAVLLGKTNMDAWAHGSSTETSDFGATKNPWDVGKLAGGSSGGSAAAVAADECIFALGSETAGSIRGPASWCGIVGLKPTYGRTSRYGLIAMGSSFDCPGPMTKNVLDAALVLKIIAGRDILDATSSLKPVEDYAGQLSGDIKGLRIGYADDYFKNVDLKVSNVVKKALAKLEEIGAKIVEIKLFDPRYAIAAYTIIQRSEVSSNLARYDGIRYGKSRSHFREEAKRRIMLGTYSLSSGHYEAYYQKAGNVRTLIVDDFKRAFKKVDLIAGPTMPATALPLGSSHDHPMFGEAMDVLNEPSSIAGLPGISIPCGFADGLPVGLQITGPHFCEAKILRTAFSYEQATDWHKRKAPLC